MAAALAERGDDSPSSRTPRRGAELGSRTPAGAIEPKRFLWRRRRKRRRRAQK